MTHVEAKAHGRSGNRALESSLALACEFGFAVVHATNTRTLKAIMYSIYILYYKRAHLRVSVVAWTTISKGGHVGSNDGCDMTHFLVLCFSSKWASSLGKRTL